VKGLLAIVKLAAASELPRNAAGDDSRLDDSGVVAKGGHSSMKEDEIFGRHSHFCWVSTATP